MREKERRRRKKAFSIILFLLPERNDFEISFSHATTCATFRAKKQALTAETARYGKLFFCKTIIFLVF